MYPAFELPLQTAQVFKKSVAEVGSTMDLQMMITGRDAMSFQNCVHGGGTAGRPSVAPGSPPGRRRAVPEDAGGLSIRADARFAATPW